MLLAVAWQRKFLFFGTLATKSHDDDEAETEANFAESRLKTQVQP